MAFVLDCSTAMAWCFEDEDSRHADRILERFAISPAVVPTIWPLEVVNVLIVAQRKRRITLAASARFLTLLRSLPIRTDEETSRRATYLLCPSTFLYASNAKRPGPLCDILAVCPRRQSATVSGHARPSDGAASPRSARSLRGVSGFFRDPPSIYA